MMVIRYKQSGILLFLMLCSLFLSSLSVGAQDGTQHVYLPFVTRTFPKPIFGFESSLSGITDSRIFAQAQSLGAYWIRLNGIEWSAVESVRGDPYNWTALVQLDSALAKAKDLGMTPVVIVRGTPTWASVTGSGCAAIKDEYLPAFIDFMAALVQRYKGRVDYWEIGNEPDVDPSLIASESPYGCWGDSTDPYYGGGRYGRMLQAIAPVMRAANPNVQIVFGGLLLDHPGTADPAEDQPGRFFEGALRSGASNSFDILAYHTYPYFNSAELDHDLYMAGVWTNLGGWTLGKANYLRGIMASYGVNKPIWLNETGLICSPSHPMCAAPTAVFFEAQANHLVRILSRAGAADIQQVSWYTLDGPGWRNGGLLDQNQVPRQAYYAYQRMISLVSNSDRVISLTGYGSAVEAYRFVKPNGVVDVLWSSSGGTVAVQVPISAYRSAVLWNGSAPPMTQNSTHMFIPVGFNAVLIERTP